MTYDFEDVKQAIIGGFGAVLLFFAIRQGEPITMSPVVGLIIGFIWLFLLYRFNKSDPLQAFVHFVGDLFVTMVITGVLALAFNMLPTEQLLSFGYFGSAAWISVWMAMPVAMLFDMNNLTNVLDRFYVRGVSGRSTKRRKK